MEEDQEELILTTDDESLSGNEEHCLPADKPKDNYRHSLIYVEHTKTEFVIIKVLLIFLTLAILVLLPLYAETINVLGDVYSLFLTNTLLSLIIFVILIFIINSKGFSKYKYLNVLKLPIKLLKLIQISFTYFLCALLIIYALDRKRVICHLQDPLKGLVLVWSFLYYFFFCQRFMCLQRIFSATVIIVGEFIALDYNLCNEFKCRGYERQHISDDTGNWSWQTHAAWTSVYIGGLALFAAYLTTLEQTFTGAIKTLQSSYLTPLVNTVSRSVSTLDASSLTEDGTDDPYVHKRINALHLAMWIHIFGVIFVILFYWTDFIPQIGKGSNSTEVWNYTISGIRCHFSNEAACKNVAAISWLFLFSYVGFVVTSIQFLILTQSAVYTVATMSTALPLAGVWWSLFQMVPIENGLLIWKPSFTGELISSILGFPIIITGLFFLCKSHFKEYQWSRTLISPLPSIRQDT